MNYNILFETLYSYSITEDVKASIIERVKDRIGEELNESLNNGSHYVAFINTLLESNISDEALDEVLDMTFGGLNEEVIDGITEEFKRTAVIRALNEWDPAPVGLRGVEREAAKQQAKQNQPKAIDRLKSAVGKVKNWAGKAVQKVGSGIKSGVEKAKQAVNQPTGLDKLKQVRSEMIDHAVKMGTGPKPAEQPKPEQLKMDFNKSAEDPKPSAEVKQPESTKTVRKTNRKKPSVKKAKNAVAQAVVAAEKPQEAIPVRRRGRPKKVTANEALEEALKLIKSTSISESSLMEITEMISNKRAAKKAVEREYKKFEKAMNSLNKTEEVKAKTGVSPVSPEQHDQMVKQAEELGNKYERVKASAERKFGKEC